MQHVSLDLIVKYLHLIFMVDTHFISSRNIKPNDLFGTTTQSDLPVLSQYDCNCLVSLADEFEIDFVCTSYTRRYGV